MGADEQLADLWQRWSPNVMAYVLRHIDRNDADDVVSEVFVVAWRRRSEVPAEPFPWLIVVARNVIANHHRTARRRNRLEGELRRLGYATHAAVDVDPVDREAAIQLLAAMTHNEREALLLVAWDGLSPAQAARVLGCSTGAFHVRVLRARRKLATLSSPTDPDESAGWAAASTRPTTAEGNV